MTAAKQYRKKPALMTRLAFAWWRWLHGLDGASLRRASRARAALSRAVTK